MKFNKAAIIKETGSTVKNKTGGWRSMRPVVDKAKCIGCGRCWADCPDNAISLGKDGKAVVDYNFCKGCSICARECPVKAIKMVKEEK